MFYRQATNTVEELLFNEEIYIRSLNCGIDGYMKRYNQKNMPNDLRGQQYRVFGNIHRIRDFHEAEFFPALKRCEMSIVKICRTFCEFVEVSFCLFIRRFVFALFYLFFYILLTKPKTTCILSILQKDYFYIYILYAINRQRSEKFCELHRTYFKDIQNEIGDKLGINSFLVQPIQRLPKYKILLGQLISELGKRLEDDGVKEKIAACCLAEKRVQRLLDTVNGSMNINDIVECYEVCFIQINFLLNRYRFIFFVFFFMILLQINPQHQGKFLKVTEFDINELETRRKYKGKVFLFDKCIIYTEIINKNKLIYRGCFRHETLGFTFEEGKNIFVLYNEKRGRQEIEFTADANMIQLWIQSLSDILMSTVVIIEKKKIEDIRQRGARQSDLGPLHFLLRLNSPNLSYGSKSLSGEAQSPTPATASTGTTYSSATLPHRSTKQRNDVQRYSTGNNSLTSKL